MYYFAPKVSTVKLVSKYRVMISSFTPLILIVLQFVDSTGGSCQLTASSMTLTAWNGENSDGRIPDTFHQIQLRLQCDDQTCLTTDYYNTSCDTEAALAQILGRNGVMNLCEESCVDDNAKKEVSVLPRTTSKSVTAEYSVVNTFPTKTSMTYDIGTTMVNAPAHTVNTTITPTACQCLGTPTPAITPAITSCSPCTRIASTVNFTVTKTSNTTIKDFVTVTSTVWAPCTLTPTARESRSYSLTTKTIIIVSTAQQSSASLTQMHVDQIQEDKACSSSAVSALGALLGMFTVLLAIVTAGWIWTCWIVKKRGRMVVNSKQNNFPNMPGTVSINSNMDTLRRLQNPLYEETTTEFNGMLPQSEGELQRGQGESEETGPTYEIIPLPAPVIKKASKKNGGTHLEKEDTIAAGGRVSVGVASAKSDDSAQDNIRLVGGGNLNNNYLPDEKTEGESGERIRDKDRENNYHLLGDAEEEREGVRENVYHILENPLDTEEDYADPDEEELINIYHVLEGPTPEREGESEGDEAEKEKTEGEEKKERDEVELEEQLTEPTAYEIPLVSGSKHNSTVLQ